MKKHAFKKIFSILESIVILFSTNTAILTTQTVTASAKTVRKHKSSHKNNKIKKIKLNVIAYSKITNFSQKTIADYHLLGESYFRTNISYNISALPSEEQTMVHAAVNGLNALNIVTLSESSNADITFSDENNSMSLILGKDIQYYASNSVENNGLKKLASSQIKINNATIQKTIKEFHLTQSQYRKLYERTVAHELGHALGLAHSSQNGSEEMAATKILNLPSTYDRPLYDQSYYDSLAVLYRN